MGHGRTRCGDYSVLDSLPNAVIDRAIAEPLAAEGGVAVVPVDMGWSDVGDYASPADVIDPVERATQVSPGGSPQQTVRVSSDDAPDLHALKADRGGGGAGCCRQGDEVSSS